MLFSNKIYLILKWIVQILLPALATLYFTLAKILGLPFAEEVIGTIAALTVFLGVLLGISTSTYNKTEAAVKIEECAKEITDTEAKG